MVFQSTLSLRRATSGCPAAAGRRRYFNPRSPCGERQQTSDAVDDARAISIHALLAESDRTRPLRCLHLRHFNPRSPCGERQARLVDQQKRAHISIHALLAESDQVMEIFRPRPFLFQSTLSLRRATRDGSDAAGVVAISIHALLAESDVVVLDGAVVHLVISIHALLAESDRPVSSRLL